MASSSEAKQPGARFSVRRGTDGGCPQGDSSYKQGKVKTGRSCINFKKLEDLNLAEAIKLVKQGAKYGGMNAVT